MHCLRVLSAHNALQKNGVSKDEVLDAIALKIIPDRHSSNARTAKTRIQRKIDQ